MFSLRNIIEFLSLNAALAAPACLVIAFLGCTLGSNLFVPAGVILVSIGVLIGAGLLPWTVILWAACGAIVGMSGSYAVGGLIGARVRGLRILQSRPELMTKAEALFARYGFASIPVAYFSGPLRAPIAAVAALAGMKWGHFEFANAISAGILCWSWSVGALSRES